ncbi:uncharacterized protein B0I36DRAFT_386229 [Microdochium trichocladiopsis]|uniref:Uncharacterized protein n=1 Tax=Microdochium trichocladiopsis TaxID=1682393 RepID=A0A9P9BMH0_9PEZI|nr:uncharacterized protein B0I36DRAFT_386229 [Microdochium trichocladiopsis]KAH7025841.1 hypothetical protein B0I36DRAFT_386229 [Microdochium trichocladiopsis]
MSLQPCLSFIARQRWELWLLLFVFCAWPFVVSLQRPTHQFETVFPAWDPRIRPLLEGKCSEAYAAYLDPTNSSNLVTYLLIDCLLEEFPEYRKAEIATAALVLGLTPFIIQQMGPRVADVGTLALRRPVLAFLIAASCPIVSADMAGTFSDPVQHLSRQAVKTMRPRLRYINLKDKRRAVVITIAATEYLAAVTTFVNLQVVAWQLATWTVCIYAPATIWQPWLWANLVILIQAGHMYSLLLRVQVLKPVSEVDSDGQSQTSHSSSGQGSLTPHPPSSIVLSQIPQTSAPSSSVGLAHLHRSSQRQDSGAGPGNGLLVDHLEASQPKPPTLPPAVATYLHREFTPMAYADPVILQHRKHGYLYLFLGYAISVSAAAHVLYGTLILSSLVFISLADAVGIVWRFGANTIICRVLLGYEMMAMREAVSGVVSSDDDEDDDGVSG